MRKKPNVNKGTVWNIRKIRVVGYACLFFSFLLLQNVEAQQARENMWQINLKQLTVEKKRSKFSKDKPLVIHVGYRATLGEENSARVELMSHPIEHLGKMGKNDQVDIPPEIGIMQFPGIKVAKNIDQVLNEGLTVWGSLAFVFDDRAMKNDELENVLLEASYTLEDALNEIVNNDLSLEQLEDSFTNVLNVITDFFKDRHYSIWGPGLVGLNDKLIGSQAFMYVGIDDNLLKLPFSLIKPLRNKTQEIIDNIDPIHLKGSLYSTVNVIKNQKLKNFTYLSLSIIPGLCGLLFGDLYEINISEFDFNPWVYLPPWLIDKSPFLTVGGTAEALTQRVTSIKAYVGGTTSYHYQSNREGLLDFKVHRRGGSLLSHYTIMGATGKKKYSPAGNVVE